jgi:flavorubredoxin
METKVDEIAEGIYRLSTWVEDVAPPAGFSFNQFLIDADEPLLFHTGMRALFPLVSEAIQRVMPLERLRWISFGHVEADECGAMNLFLEAAPNAQVTYNGLGCMVSLNDLCDRPPVPLGPDEVRELGGRQVRNIDTPHVPHAWEAHVMYEETTGTLLCGDLLTQVGDGAALVTDDLVQAAMDTEALFRSTSLAPDTATVMRGLGDLQPSTLAVMHGSSFQGDGAKALYDLATEYETRYLQPAS